MRRRLVIVVGIGMLALTVASAAQARISWDGSTATWSIGRGDVITYVGKDGLVPSPVVVWSFTAQESFTCVFNDSTTIPASTEGFGELVYFAQPRYANGTDTITGYTAGPTQVIDGAFWNPTFACLDAAEGVDHGGVAGITDLTTSDYAETLTFQGVVLPAPVIGNVTSTPQARPHARRR